MCVGNSQTCLVCLTLKNTEVLTMKISLPKTKINLKKIKWHKLRRKKPFFSNINTNNLFSSLNKRNYDVLFYFFTQTNDEILCVRRYYFDIFLSFCFLFFTHTHKYNFHSSLLLLLLFFFFNARQSFLLKNSYIYIFFLMK